MRVGEAVRQVRGHVLQEDLAGRLGIDQGTLSRWERSIGKGPTLDDLQSIEKVLGIRHGTILRLAGYVEDATDAREAIEADPNLLPNYKTIALESYDTCLRLSITERDGSGLSTAPRKRAREIR